jgi:hypothetical protein
MAGTGPGRYPGRSEAESRDPGTPSVAVLGPGTAPHRFALPRARDDADLTIENNNIRTRP